MPVRSRGRWRMLPAAVALVLSCGRAAAEAPFVSSLVPQSDGSWRIAVGGTEARGTGLEVWIDGVKSDAVLARAEGAAESKGGSGELLARLPLLPETSRRLELRRRGHTLAALDLAALSGEQAGFAGWTIYHVMLEMFANGDAGNDGQFNGWRHPRYAGGDLRGVLEKVDYLRELGVNAVWLSPMFQAQTSHGYDVQNYYRVGDAVGVPGDAAASLALFRQLREALAQRGIRTILDLPLNHASRSYDREKGDPLAFKPKATGAKQEAEKLWESWGAGYQYWNFDHPATREFLQQVALYWLREEKVDGLRLDYVRGVPREFWGDFLRVVKRARKKAFLIGECWIDAGGPEVNARDIATYYAELPEGGRQFDSLLDFPMQSVLSGVFAQGGSLAEAESWLQRKAAIYGEGALPTYFLDNHDLARFSDRGADRDRLLAAIGYLAALNGPIVLFYGTETGLAGGEAKDGFTDSGRLPMPWSALDRDLVGRVAAVLGARAAHPTLTSGARRPLLVEAKATVVAKVGKEETLLVGVNLGSAPREVSLEVGALLPAGSELAPVVGTSPARVDAAGRLAWTLPPAAAVIVARSTAPPS